MNNQQLLAEMEHPRWRPVLQSLLGEDETARRAALTELSDAVGLVGRAKRPEEFATSAADGARILQIAMSTDLPGWTPGSLSVRIVELFWSKRSPLFVAAIRDRYAEAPPRVQGAALVVLAAQGTQDAMAVVRDLINEHGFTSGMYFRFFDEVGKHIEVASGILADLLIKAGADKFLPSVVDLINVALERKYLTVHQLLPVHDELDERARRLLADAKAAQRPGMRRVEDRALRASLGALLDLAGTISDRPGELLIEAQQLGDPRIAMICALTLLQHGQVCPAPTWRMIAAADETREPLFRALRMRGKLDLFPAEFLTLDAFAACDMVKWLMHPSELGDSPDALEVKGRLVGTTEEGERIYFLWRFTGGGKAYAGVSGPYSPDAPGGPVSGNETFSNFDEWDSRTPEAHFEAIQQTLTRWSVEWCKRSDSESGIQQP